MSNDKCKLVFAPNRDISCSPEAQEAFELLQEDIDSFFDNLFLPVDEDSNISL